MPGQVLNALENMSKDKSPGNNGLTRRFYIEFYNIIENVLFNQSTSLTK